MSKTSPWDRFQRLIFKRTDFTDGPSEPVQRSAEELEEAERSADDKERLIGLIAAPLGALIAFLAVHSLVAHDPATGTKHVSLQFYDWDFVALVVLAMAMLTFALWRKRLFLGIVLAIFGLDLFNLHQWGFAAPFVLAGAWYLVRAYRIHTGLTELTGRSTTARWRSRGKSDASDSAPVVGRSKRYTPPKRGG